ncbi:YkvA family protein [Variovorax paradoxus]|uniref:YkvA family protein n=1 Tax=Variovorax paradoxus TaxID=34073 RepID=UPI0029C8251B|nr:YkvA family protein [Variovorax paradoxus]WPH23184.1 YkvA family protein [Variovorax paradoxus]
MAIFQRIRQWASRIKRDAVTLWFAYRHPGTPWFAKLLAAFVVAYALSPIDLIPDFIPVLGYLDDALLLPGLIWLNIRLIPADVLEECRERADLWMKEQGTKPRSIAGAVLVLAIWIGLGAALWAWFNTQN